MTEQKMRSWRDVPFAAIPWRSSRQYRTGDWRTERPLVDLEKCTNCLLCFVYCPDMSIRWDGDKIEIDYDHCKGCGICADVCPIDAIAMEAEKA